MAYQIWPGPPIELGRLVGSVFRDTPGLFEIYPLIGDWRNYDDETLLLSTEQATLWQMETEELRRALAGQGNLPFRQVKKLWQEWLCQKEQFLAAIKEAFRGAAGMGAHWVVQRGAELEREEVTPESAARELEDALTKADRLCEASLQTGNPVELYW